MPPESEPCGHLHAPWRIAYIKNLEKDPAERDPLAKRFNDCFLCAAASYHLAVAELDEGEEEAMRRRLVVWRSEHHAAVINRYPYTSGHLMIAPRRHLAELEELTAEEAADMHEQTVKGVRLLKKVMNPQGFNVGLNQGRCAGAGIPGHLHCHIVPRWNGDTNFMSVVGNVRIVPQAAEELWGELRSALDEPPGRGD